MFEIERAIIVTGFKNSKLQAKFAVFRSIMAKTNNIVHLYFRKEDEEGKSLLKINPIHMTGIEIIVPLTGEPSSEEFEVPSDYETNFVSQGYVACNPLEFNLYLNGLV